MKTIVLYVSFLFLSATTSFATNHPFDWPSSYSIEYVQQSPGDPTKIIYTVSGNKARNESADLKMSNNASVSIFDLDE